MNPKIRPEHLSRPAKVYVRQSTMQQVFEHHGSTERQYDLVELAKRLGWDEKPVRKALGPDKRITPTSRVGAWRSSCPPFAT